LKEVIWCSFPCHSRPEHKPSLCSPEPFSRKAWCVCGAAEGKIYSA